LETIYSCSDIEHKTKYVETALLIAIRCKRVKVIQEFLKAGADIEVKI